MVNNNRPSSNDGSTPVVSCFSPHAAYYNALDCIEYVNKDCTIIAERVDEFLTLFRQNATDDYVGFKLKGFRNFFETSLRHTLDLKDEDFVTLKEMMLVICTEKANEFVANKDSYKIAYKMCQGEAVKLQAGALNYQQAA